ncbi:MAG: peptide deformylase [Bacillariaceae sp.]|jgi:peptide deformylase
MTIRRFRSRMVTLRLISMTMTMSVILLLSQQHQQILWCHGLLQPTITPSPTCTTTNTRREIFRSLLGTSIAGAATITATIITPTSSSSAATTIISNDRPFIYSGTWIGTSLKIQSLNDAVQQVTTTSNSNSDNTNTNTSLYYWTMGKWPDPILRRPANPIDPKMWLLRSSSTNNQEQQQLLLQKAATILRNTARREGAVGLAAQQCGVDANMIYLSSSSGSTGTGNNDDELVFINPRIVDRSPESNMNVWTEECLVLPPTFRATVLRDDWIDIEYDFLYEFRRSSSSVITGEEVMTPTTQGRGGTSSSSMPMKRRFFGEQSRCLQHELDHDRGILITDHVGLEELENDMMRQIETDGHTQRMALAYSRE